MTEEPPRRIGVMICQCGGNISDYVDTEKVRAEVAKQGDVVATRVEMFACSDSAQESMVQMIREKKLDGVVVCSCSPKLHLSTFRAMTQRGGLNPYEYTQVNIREQCSWAHTHDKPAATEKALRLVRAGVAKTALSTPLERMRVETIPQVLVIGAGIAGLRAALALSDLGISVHLIEKAPEPGGHVARWGRVFPNDKDGRGLIDTLVREVRARENIVLYLGTELTEMSGRIGSFRVKVRTPTAETISLNVGSIVVATGFETYAPKPGELGFGLEGVVTLPELKELLATNPSRLEYHGKAVRSIAYVYCVGSREEGSETNLRTYCSRYCCSATSHIATVITGMDPGIRQFHLFRDIRTYGKYEAIYERALRGGSVFLRFGEEAPPSVTSENGQLVVKVKDRLMAGEEVELRPDLVVLVTGMVPREDGEVARVLKIPIGKDGFFHEIHVKLRPVETVVDGVFIAGAAQGPKNLAESVTSSMAAVSKAAALLLKGYVDLDPMVAEVNPDLCAWCDACTLACPYGAVEKVDHGGTAVARINGILCKGEGACVPVCPKQAVSVKGYTNDQVRSMIDALVQEVA
ncbi:MAG: CoB--CoM heterodisulfide reductase iron-sulfur subunit A family protein [Thermoplasmata archaeon]|jgi:heterodisulfide reductase subunit A